MAAQVQLPEDIYEQNHGVSVLSAFKIARLIDHRDWLREATRDLVEQFESGDIVNTDFARQMLSETESTSAKWLVHSALCASRYPHEHLPCDCTYPSRHRGGRRP